jgi:hypothetical protein
MLNNIPIAGTSMSRIIPIRGIKKDGGGRRGFGKLQQI